MDEQMSQGRGAGQLARDLQPNKEAEPFTLGIDLDACNRAQRALFHRVWGSRCLA